MERKMSEEKPVCADELTKAKKPADIQLNEGDLSKASGGGGGLRTVSPVPEDATHYEKLT
jgi:hypothetical protein